MFHCSNFVFALAVHFSPRVVRTFPGPPLEVVAYYRNQMQNKGVVQMSNVISSHEYILKPGISEQQFESATLGAKKRGLLHLPFWWTTTW